MLARILQFIFGETTPDVRSTPNTIAPVFSQVGPLGPLLADLYLRPRPDNADHVRWALMDVQAEAESRMTQAATELVHAIDDLELSVDELLAEAVDQDDGGLWYTTVLQRVSSEACDVAYALEAYFARHPQSQFR
jgi:hypothetical protein